MTIQRYKAFISNACEWGCGEAMDDNGDYVKYEDHLKDLDNALKAQREACFLALSQCDDIGNIEAEREAILAARIEE